MIRRFYSMFLIISFSSFIAVSFCIIYINVNYEPITFRHLLGVMDKITPTDNEFLLNKLKEGNYLDGDNNGLEGFDVLITNLDPTLYDGTNTLEPNQRPQITYTHAIKPTLELWSILETKSPTQVHDYLLGDGKDKLEGLLITYAAELKFVHQKMDFVGQAKAQAYVIKENNNVLFTGQVVRNKQPNQPDAKEHFMMAREIDNPILIRDKEMYERKVKSRIISDGKPDEYQKNRYGFKGYNTVSGKWEFVAFEQINTLIDGLFSKTPETKKWTCSFIGITRK